MILRDNATGAHDPAEDAELADSELKALLARLPTPDPPPGLFERAIAQARAAQGGEAGQLSGRRSGRLAKPGGVLAAGIAVLAVAALVALAALAPREPVPVVTVALNQPETVRLVFDAPDPLDHATMTVTLPDGVELAGFPGEREIRWDTSLAEGANLLPLTPIATSAAGGELTAHLEHESRDRTFRVRIDVG